MSMIKIKKCDHFDETLPLPTYETKDAAGADMRASFAEKGQIVIKAGQRLLVSTGLCFEIEPGFEVQIRPRSGLSLKTNLLVVNSPGTIDADYRGEIGVILVNLSNEEFTVENGERIAQLVIAKHERAEWLEVETLSETDRGEGGFGSTGVKWLTD